MLSTENWWTGEIDWSTPAGQLLQRFVGALPGDRPFFHADIDVRRDIIAPAIAQRRQGYGEPPPDYKKSLGE